MKVDSPHFGSLEVASNKIIEFPAGLPGFEECKHFTLVEVDSSQQVLAILQSVDKPEVAFSVTTPDLLGLHYEFTLTEDEAKILKATRAEDIAVMLILREDDSPHRREVDAPVKANLMAPLVINAQSWIGLQKVIAKLGCEVTLRAAD
ncbi:flagellar assembly protein FliW [Uliginosibacterium gangwonense]|uniref:flagellar assembly protein FliW n=1 Tax=Uliginosibacterium gangwonense TaxID=392736 RepID=UPI0003657AED|nr:flagellar assembly protein FliW [Uliginosibacterium gangwonense]